MNDVKTQNESWGMEIVGNKNISFKNKRKEKNKIKKYQMKKQNHNVKNQM